MTTFDAYRRGILTEEVCGTCVWHRPRYFDDDWFCDCQHSENFLFETEYQDTCSCWEERE